MVTPDVAARIAAVSPRTIYRWIESGGLHFSEAADHRLFICVESVSAAARSARKSGSPPEPRRSE